MPTTFKTIFSGPKKLEERSITLDAEASEWSIGGSSDEEGEGEIFHVVYGHGLSEDRHQWCKYVDWNRVMAPSGMRAPVDGSYAFLRTMHAGTVALQAQITPRITRGHHWLRISGRWCTMFGPQASMWRVDSVLEVSHVSMASGRNHSMSSTFHASTSWASGLRQT